MTQFLITVDTETYLGPNRTLLPFGANLYGETRGQEFGVGKIMEIAEKYGARATFFIDVYMHYAYGKPGVQELTERIARRGHDVQLHAHTSWLPGSHSGFLHDFPLARQAEIIREGKDLLSAWTGRAPIAFRAGAYSANLDTIEALAQNQFIIDSSYFRWRSTCPLSRQLDHRYSNREFRIDGVLELPVTIYWLLNTRPMRKVSKLDFNACSLAELRSVVPKLIDAGVRYAVLFLHSFSFIRWNADFSAFVPNLRAVERFERLMEEISADPRASFVTTPQVAGQADVEPPETPDFVPEVSIAHLFPRLMQRIYE